MLSGYIKCVVLASAGTMAFSYAAHAQQSGQPGQSSAPPAPASADALQEVTVTARRIGENLQRVPIAITVVPKAVIEDTGYFSSENFSLMAPGLTATQAIDNRQQVYFNIRGQVSGVVTYFDEVPITNPTPSAISPQSGLYVGTVLDNDSTQVLRGPQGTLFGRNATGGAVLFAPNKPTEDFDAYVQVSGGNYDYQEYQAMVNVPLLEDKVLLRIVGEKTERDGFTTNLYNGQALDDEDSEVIRATLTIRPFQGFENRTLYQFVYSNTDSTGAQITYASPQSPFVLLAPSFGVNLQQEIAQNLANGPRVANMLAPPGVQLQDREKQTFISNTTTYDVIPTLTLKNIFGYFDTESFNLQNFNGSLIPFIEGIAPPGVPTAHNQQFTDEIQGQFSLMDKKLTGTAGAFYALNEPTGASENLVALFSTIPTPAGAGQNLFADDIGPRAKQTSVAGFISATLDLSDWVLDGLKLTGGYRHTTDRINSGGSLAYAGSPNYSYVPSGCAPGGAPPTCYNYTPLSASFSVSTYNFDLDYQITPDVGVYIATRRGYKPGGFNSAAAQTTPFAEFQPEFVTDYEIGVKADADIGGIKTRTDVAVYYGKYTNVQEDAVVHLSVYNDLPAGSQYGTVTQDAAKATVQGIEAEFTVLPVERLALSARMAITDAHYHDYTEIIQQPGIPLVPVNGDGEAFPNTPAQTYSFSANYVLPIPDQYGKISVGGSYYWQAHSVGGQGGNLFEAAFDGIPAWSTTNFNATWSGINRSSVDATFFITDAFNQIHITDVEAPSVFAYRSVVYSEPRMFGLKLRYRFGKSAT
jgi:iron complex outermembrane receptor protein